MNDAEHRRRSFKKHRAQRTELRAQRAESGHEVGRRRPADDPAHDPECRATRLRPSGSRRLRPRRGITRDRLEAQLAAQHGACACCGETLGRDIRIDRWADDLIALLCPRCRKLTTGLLHARKHAEAFEAFFKEYGMTVELARFYEAMRIMGWTPAQNRAGGRPT